MCGGVSSTFFPCHDSTMALQKDLIHRRIYQFIMKQVCYIVLLKPFFHILYMIGTRNVAFICLLDVFACFHVILGIQFERLFGAFSMYLTTLSMTIISMGSYPVSRIKRVCGVCYFTHHTLSKWTWDYIALFNFHPLKKHQCHQSVKKVLFEDRTLNFSIVACVFNQSRSKRGNIRMRIFNGRENYQNKPEC